MPWVVDSGLNSVVDGKPTWGLHGSHFLVDFLGKTMSHMIGMLLKIGIFLLGSIAGGVVVRHLCSRKVSSKQERESKNCLANAGAQSSATGISLNEKLRRSARIYTPTSLAICRHSDCC
uniref:6-phosphogluconolactonase-like n=1 Tax=Phallusia mammillata TaxID=59560 RepID=A0A6F9DPA3_9ASCI|nr:6-phosphogluconolactonase-like [Phallusia mammillata]